MHENCDLHIKIFSLLYVYLLLGGKHPLFDWLIDYVTVCAFNSHNTEFLQYDIFVNFMENFLSQILFISVWLMFARKI